MEERLNNIEETINRNKSNNQNIICFIMNFSTRFINTPFSEIDREVNNTLKELGKLYDADYCCIYLNNKDKMVFNRTYEWVKKGIEISIKDKTTDLNKFKWAMGKAYNNNIVQILNPDELPDEAVREKEVYKSLGCKSMMIAPIVHESKVFGFIMLITISYDKKWTSEQIDLLKIICVIFANAIKRKKYEKALQNEIKKQTKLKEILKDSEEKYRKLTLSIQDAIILIDNEGNIVNWNKAAEKIYGYTFKEAVGKKLHKLTVPPEIYEKNKKKFSKTITLYSGKLMNKITETQAMRKDGSRFMAEISLSTVTIKGSTHVVGIVRDITERRQTQKKIFDAMEAAEAANKAKSQFLANMSHEIRTPMNGIIGFLDLLSKTSLDCRQSEYLKEIKTASDSLMSLINDLLDFSKIEAKRLELEDITFNLRKVMEEVISLYSPRACSKGIEIYLIIDNLISNYLKGDPEKLKQVIENLVSNAVKFTEKGEAVVKVKLISQTDENIEVLFCITDTGIGISDSDSKRLFEPFIQVDASTTRKFGGTGLGLTISEKIVEMMSGKINVESEPGKGSAFSFQIGFKKAKAVLEKTLEIDKNMKGIGVLLVGGSSTNRKIVNYYLKSAGCCVCESESGADAIEMLRNNLLNGKEIKAVLLDSKLPDMSELELASLIKSDEKTKDIIINLFTSYTNYYDRETAVKAGISELILKPVYKYELFYRILISMGVSDLSFSGIGEKQTTEIAFDENLKKNTKLLLVEDNLTNQKLAISMLKTAGLSCDTAKNGYEAINALKDNHYDLVLMDCQMPVMDGYEAAKLIRSEESGDNRIIIIAMTANVIKSDIENCFLSGMDDYISKPFKTNDLLSIIAKWLKRDASISENGFLRKNGLKEDHLYKETMDEIPRILDKLSQDQLLNRADIYEIYNDYVDILPDYLAKIQEAIDGCNSEAVSLGAHTIKGSSASLRLKYISECAAEIEKQGKTGNLSVCRDYMKKLTGYCRKNIKKIKI